MLSFAADDASTSSSSTNACVSRSIVNVTSRSHLAEVKILREGNRRIVLTALVQVNDQTALIFQRVAVELRRVERFLGQTVESKLIFAQVQRVQIERVLAETRGDRAEIIQRLKPDGAAAD